MEPKSNDTRTAFPGGPEVSVASVNDTPELNDLDMFAEDGAIGFVEDEAPSVDDIEAAEKEAKKMSDEEIKIKSLNQAINIAKLMSDVTTEDVLEIAAKVAKFIKG